MTDFEEDLATFVQNPIDPRPAPVKNFAGPNEVPAHIPTNLVFDPGLMVGTEYLKNPHEYMAQMHEKFPPVFFAISPYRNSWLLTKHEDCLFVLRHADIFRNLDAVPFQRDPADYFLFIPQEIDPPDHRKYRNIVDPLFSPAGVAKLEGKIRQRAGDLIDAFIENGECEFTTAFGRPLPVSVFLDLMGLPQEDLTIFVEWADTMIHSQDPEEVGSAFASAIAYLRTAIAEKKSSPDGGVISLIANAEIDGRPLNEKEVFGFVCFLWLGGLDTVYATMNNIWLWLARNPDRVQEIIDRPGDINNVVEELLRRFSVTFSGRVVTRDIEVRGVLFRKGDRVATCLPAANFDPDAFPEPLRVDFDRPRKTILAFTVGVHSCMGGHLARLELKVAIEEWLKRIPAFAVRSETEISYKPGGVVGPDKVPLVWQKE